MNEASLAERGKPKLTIGSLLLAIGAIGSLLALVRGLDAGYAAIPKFSAPSYPENIAIPTIVSWIVVLALTSMAWRRSSFDMMMWQILVMSLIVLARHAAMPRLYRMLFPLLIFGAFVTVPLLLRRASRRSDSSGGWDRWIFLSIDSALGSIAIRLLADFAPTS